MELLLRALPFMVTNLKVQIGLSMVALNCLMPLFFLIQKKKPLMKMN
jgi:hypothetical protein